VDRRPDPLWRTVVGGVLRTERRLQGLTLRQVAGVAGISVPYLSEIERGRKEASSEMLAAASKALGLRLVDLLDRAHRTLAQHEARAVTSVSSISSLTSVSAAGLVPAPSRSEPSVSCSFRLAA
jgi:transcriptional regulator with XRE-family HTH domain